MNNTVTLDQLKQFCQIPVDGKPCNQPVTISLQAGPYTVYCCEYHAGALVAMAMTEQQ